VAWIVIAGFMAFIKRHSFIVFGWYRIILGIIVLIILGR
ncbi:MAG: undecaprenyl-diphosphatase, partial [Candidatus Desantisbacteria bacterium]